MTSKVSPRFRRLLAELPPHVRVLARKNYRLWVADQRHPSLHFKCVNDATKVYSIRVGRAWRALGQVRDQTIEWFWIGNHTEYDVILDHL